MRKVIFILLFFIIYGCASNSKKFEALQLELDPKIETYNDFSFNAKKYKTFSIVPISLYNKDSNIQGILEKQLLFTLRNIFERRGYEFINLKSDPDFIITLEAYNIYREIHVPEQSVSVPQWVNGKTMTTSQQQSGTFYYGNIDSFNWGSYRGNYQGSSTTTTYIPGHMSTENYTTPAHTEGVYRPSAGIYVYDGKSGKNVWTGIGMGTSKNSDLRLSSQVLLMKMANKFPERNYKNDTYNSFGFDYSITTLDGNNYYPVVLNIDDNSIMIYKDIKVYDIISKVNNISTLNKSYREIYDLLTADKNTGIEMILLREKKTIKINTKNTNKSDTSFESDIFNVNH